MMKREFRFFSITQYEEEAEYLREHHRNGWKFVQIKWPGIYSFEKCEPEDMIYQLDYNQEGIAHKEEYVQMFEDCGWEYLLDAFGYSYFRKPAAHIGEEESIFCDDASRMDMLKRIIRGRGLPILILTLCVLVPQLFRYINIYQSGDESVCSVIAAISGGLLAMLIIGGSLIASYIKLKKKMER